jgi:hypothetical protein
MIPLIERQEVNDKCGKRQFAATPALPDEMAVMAVMVG